MAPDETLQDIAMENNLSETAFFSLRHLFIAHGELACDTRYTALMRIATLMSYRIVPINQFSAVWACMGFDLLVDPSLHADITHQPQIAYHILVVDNAVFNMDRHKGFKALARKVAALEAASDSLFLCAYPEPVSAIHAMLRQPVRKAASAFLRKQRASAAEKPANTGDVCCTLTHWNHPITYVIYADGVVVELSETYIDGNNNESTLKFGGSIIEVEKVSMVVINGEFFPVHPT